MQVDGKTVTIECEGYLRGQGTDFDIYANSIRAWDPPDADVAIDQSMRAHILDLLRAEMAARNLTIDIQ
jgi:Immunity protein 74